MAQGRTGYVDFTASSFGGSQTLRVNWSETYSGNKSTVTITSLQLKSSTWVGQAYNGDMLIKINGETAITLTIENNSAFLNNFDAFATVTNSGATITGSVSNISHDANGTKTVAISIAANTYPQTGPIFWSSDPGSIVFTAESKNITLTTFPVGTLSINAGANTSVSVNRTSSTYSNTGTVSAGTSLYYGDALKIIFTPAANYTIATHTVNGNAFTSGNTFSPVTGNVSIVATAQALGSTVSATNANIGSTSTITVSKYNSSYYHSLQYSFGSLSGYITSSGGVQSSEAKFSGTSISWTVPTTFYAQIPNAKTGTCTITCRTYSSSSSTTVLGTPTTATITVTATGSPTVSGTVVDQNSTTIALTGSSAKLVRYMSNALCTITATAQNSANISTKSINGESVSGTTKTYNGVSATSFVFSATDSRGYTTSSTVTPTMVNYIPLTINPEITRTSPTSSTLVMKFSGNYFNGSFGSRNNTLTVRYRYKLSTASSYGSWTTISSGSSSYTISGNGYSTVSAGYTLSGEFAYNSDYDFQVQAYDGNGAALTTVTKTVALSAGVPVFDWGKSDFQFNVPVYIGADQKLRLFQDGEGGNIRIYPPDNTTVSGMTVNYWEIDANSGNLRVFANVTNNTTGTSNYIFPVYVNANNTISLASALPVGSGGTGGTTAATALSNLGGVSKSGDTMTGTLNVKSTVKAITDNEDGIWMYASNAEGGNLRFYPPSSARTSSGVAYWEVDSFNGDLRAYSYYNGNVIIGATLLGSGGIKLGATAYGTSLPSAGNAGRIFFLKA